MRSDVRDALTSAVESEQSPALMSRRIAASDFAINQLRRRILRLCENLPEDMTLSELRRELEE